MVPLLDMLVSARAGSARKQDGLGENCGNGNCDDRAEGGRDNASVDNDDDDDDAPLFDAVWFLMVSPGRPSRFTPPTAKEILAPHGVSLAPVGHGGAVGGTRAVDLVGKNDAVSCGAEEEGEGRSGTAPEFQKDTATGAWQRTLEQVTCYMVKYFLCLFRCLSMGVLCRCIASRFLL